MSEWQRPERLEPGGGRNDSGAPGSEIGWQEAAERLLEELGDRVQARRGPTWVRVMEDPDSEAGLSFQANDGPDCLLGWTAPPDCRAVGMVATGRMHALSADAFEGDLGCLPGEQDRMARAVERHSTVRMACVMGRDGGIGWSLALPGGETARKPPEGGRLYDTLRRCLRLPTAPPETPASEVHAAAWVASVLAGALDSPRRLSWSDCTSLHPLARVLAGDLESADGGLGVDLADLLRIAASAWSWPEMRAQAAAGNLSGLIDAELALWMDDGMFSRWLLASLPSVEDLLEAARPYLVPSAARRLAHSVLRPARTGAPAPGMTI